MDVDAIVHALCVIADAVGESRTPVLSAQRPREDPACATAIAVLAWLRDSALLLPSGRVYIDEAVLVLPMLRQQHANAARVPPAEHHRALDTLQRVLHHVSWWCLPSGRAQREFRVFAGSYAAVAPRATSSEPEATRFEATAAATGPGFGLVRAFLSGCGGDGRSSAPGANRRHLVICSPKAAAARGAWEAWECRPPPTLPLHGTIVEAPRSHSDSVGCGRPLLPLSPPPPPRQQLQQQQHIASPLVLSPRVVAPALHTP